MTNNVVTELWDTVREQRNPRRPEGAPQWRMSDPGCAMLQFGGHTVLVARRLKLDANPVTANYHWEHWEDGTLRAEGGPGLERCLEEGERRIDAQVRS